NRVVLGALFSLIPPPPGSTLFPSTTLFRSHSGFIGPYPVTVGDQGIIRIVEHLLGLDDGLLWIPFPNVHFGQIVLGNRFGEGQEDRKSTRLNSSHVKISYAVFCLKKKISKM